jgi:uncharacterized OB-fold protein
MQRRGTIYTYSVVHVGTEVFKDETPYAIAIVEENDRKIITRIEGYTKNTEIRIGMEVAYLTDDKEGNAIYRFI